MANLTKAQLIERLIQVEDQCAAFERERDALMVAQRPSRHIVPIAQPHEHLVRMGNVLCRKVITHNGFSTQARYVPV